MAWISGGLGLGNSGIHDLARMLTSTAFDRKLESQADRKAVEYLQKAGINPEAFAVFMDRLAAKEKGNPAPPVWLSTHPASPARASQIRQLTQKNQERIPYRASLSPSDWTALKNSSNP
jgi:predicted Zn-dependent protease